jgi:hypothetical protein
LYVGVIDEVRVVIEHIGPGHTRKVDGRGKGEDEGKQR